MAKVDAADTSIYMNPAAYSQVKDEKKTKESRRAGGAEFSRLFDDLRGMTADEIGPLQNMSASEEAVNLLMDEVRNAGDILQNRPFPEEIMKYKQAVRNFINYVVQNAYSLDHEKGTENRFKPQFKGGFSSDEAKASKRYTKIQVIDNELEKFAANLLTGQRNKMEIVRRLEEIRGLLVDLIS